MTQNAKSFFDLHQNGFVLPNAWDAASARVFEQAGFPAIGTTSAGIAYSHGVPDGQRLTRAEMLRAFERIATRVHIPVNADIEAGYGDAPSEVGRTTRDFMAAGAVGLNLEDAKPGSQTELYTLLEQQKRIADARKAATEPVYINARTDTYLIGFGHDEHERFIETITRGRAYLEAGANSVFVPLATDPQLIRRLKDEIGGPITVMAFPGAPRATALLEAGASRVSLGHSAMVATLGLMDRIARELLETGTYDEMQRTFYGFQEAAELFPQSL
jgi:2-methylisocitrate lyase-like PEP mutase family enzyme